MDKARGVCKFADVTPDRAGRVIMRRDNMYRCKYPVPELPFPMPVSATLGWEGFNWPPRLHHIDKEDCAGCPCWTPREEATS